MSNNDVPATCPKVFFDVSIGGKMAGRIEFALRKFPIAFQFPLTSRFIK
jgi:hypothetical protein